MYCGVQTFKICAASFIIHTASIAQSDKERPLRLVGVHVQLLPFFSSYVIFNNVRFPIVQLQDTATGKFLCDSMDYGMNRHEGGLGQGWVFTTSQCLLCIGIGSVLASTGLFCHGHNVITLGSCYTDISNIYIVLF